MVDVLFWVAVFGVMSWCEWMSYDGTLDSDSEVW